MPRIRTTQRRRVYSSAGRSLGTISAVLFHPSEPRVVGYEVKPDAYYHVIERRERYVLASSVTFVGDDAARLDAERLPADAAGERGLGYSWHETVVWRGMPVVSAEGGPVGAVHDVVYDRTGGHVTRLEVSTGAFGDAAVGRLEIEGALVRGFDGERVVVLPGYNAIGATGGIAKQAAAGAAVVAVQGERLAGAALDTAASAAAAIGRSFRGGLARRAVDKVKSLMGEDE